jgi:hypothetical protein
MSTTQYLYTQRKDNTNEVTVAPNISDLDVTNTYEYLTNDTTLRQALPSDIISNGEIQAAIEYRNAFKQGDVITALNVFLSNVNSVYFKQADFSLENILYWYQKLKLSNKEITSYQSQVSYYAQNILTNQLAGAARFSQNATSSGSFNQNNYFDNISDSIGLIVNSKYIQLDSTLPLFDINQQYYGVPIPYSTSIENKMSATARNVAFDLSQKTTMLMRRNLMGIGYTNPALAQNMNADASTSHGLNLINDLPTFVTINESLGMLKDKLSSLFAEAKVFGFVQYMCNIANETAMNLRDIFPRTPGDRDFTVITSAENAQASQAIAQQEADEALAEQTLYAQQQGFANFTTTSNGTVVPAATNTVQGGVTVVENVDANTPSNKYLSSDGRTRSELVSDGNGLLSADFDGATNPLAGKEYQQKDTKSGLDSNTTVGVVVNNSSLIGKQFYVTMTNPDTGATKTVLATGYDTNPSHGIGATTLKPFTNSRGKVIPPPIELSSYAIKQFGSVGVGIDKGNVTIKSPVKVTVTPVTNSATTVTSTTAPRPGAAPGAA